MATAPWTAHPHCPAHLRGEVEAHVRALPPAFLNEPLSGEVFDNVGLCRERLQGFAFAQGFAITQQSGSMKQARPRFYFHCIHHGNSTRNYRKLEEHVERDEEDKVTSRRKQEATTINARNCPYLIYLAFKQIGKRGSREFGLVLGIKNSSHSHSMAVNPLIYAEHQKALSGYQTALDLSKSLRSAYISYSAARRVLEQAGFPLDRKSYYNLRHRALSAEKDEFAGLIIALKDAGFVFECRMEEEIDQQSGEVVDIQLQQIWFAHPDQIRYAQRFIAGWTLFVDGTFNTNARNLVLLVMAGITNCNRTFVAALSFARSESKMSFDFIFWSLKQRIFYSSIPLPRLVLSDQAAGMTASLPTALPNAILQYCDWHAVENVMKRLADKGYKKEAREELRDILWRFVKSQTQEELATRRIELHSKLKQDEIKYLEEYWGPREIHFLRIYTRSYPNLGSHSNQRSESIYPVTTKILNKNIGMEEAARRLGETIKAKFRELNEEEAYTGSKLPRTLDLHAFSWLADTVTFQAIQRLSTEWQATKLGCQDGSLQAISDICTSCEILLRFGLPCKHYLRRICLNGSPIPRSLLHPRWWLQGEPVRIADWSPLYQTVDLPSSSSQNTTVQSPFLSPTRTQMTGLGLQVIEARDNLTGYARQRYENAAAQAQRGLIEFAQELGNDDLHVRMPDAVKGSSWRRQFKTHDKVNKRLMTGAEAAERNANNREQAITREARQEANMALTASFVTGPIPLTRRPPPPPPPDVEIIPDTPPHRSAAAAATTTTMVRRSSLPQEEEEEGEEAIDRAFIPPLSTAPAVMTQSRAGRKRALTMKALEAEQAPKRGAGQGRARRRGGAAQG